MLLRARTKYFPAAIEIGANSLKLLQLAKIKYSYKIAKADYIALERDKGAPASALKHSLKKLVKKNKIKGEAVTSLPLEKISPYTYTIPNMPLDEIQSALLWKVRQNLVEGVSFDDISFDYIHNSIKPDDNKDIHALVFILAKKIALDTVKLFKDVSLNLISIAPQPYAIIKLLFLLKNISEQETVLVIQLGAGSSSITIVSCGYPYLMIPLAVSGNGFTQSLSGYYQYDWAKAEALKIKEGLGELQLKKAQNAQETGCFPMLSSQLENLILDIERAFQHFSQHLAKSKVSAFGRVILCGGTARLKNLDKFLSDKLKVPVVVFDPVNFFVSHLEYKANPDVLANSTAFAGVLGLSTDFIENEQF